LTSRIPKARVRYSQRTFRMTHNQPVQTKPEWRGTAIIDDRPASASHKAPSVCSPRLLMVAYAFPPLNHSGTIRSGAFAHYLPEFGIDTTVLTDIGQTSSRHPSGVAVERSDTWDEENQPYAIRRLDWQLSSPPTRMSAFLNRLPLGSTYVRSAQRSRFLSRAGSQAVDLLQGTDFDIVYGSGAPPEALLLARKIAAHRRCPLVLDLRDPWSYQPPLPYRHTLDFLAERNLEKRTLAAAAAVLVTTDATAELLTRKLGVPRERVHVVPNGFDERDFDGQQPATPPRDRFVVTPPSRAGGPIRQ